MRGAVVAKLILRRLLLLIPLALIVSFGVFSLLYIAPGDPVQVLIGERQVTPELRQSLIERHHLDEPFLVQYWYWLQGALQFDLGQSTRSSLPVLSIIRDRAGVSLFLGLYAFVLAIAIGVPAGVVAGVRRGGHVDRLIVVVALVGISTPVFVTGVALLYVFAVFLGWFPTYGTGQGLVDSIWHFTLPALALALSAIALIVRFTRAGVLGAVGTDYVVFATSRGLSRARVIVKYVLRNSLVPIITSAGMVLVYTITGSVLVEQVFSLPGIGSLLVESVRTRDVPVVQGVVLLISILVVLISLAVDLGYLASDRRISLGKRSD